MNNSFQEWAKKYAAKRGFIAVPQGNWVLMTDRCEADFTVCMGYAAVQEYCEANK